MKPIYETKDFLSLESEEKLRILEIEKQKYLDENLEELLASYRNEIAEKTAELSDIEEKIINCSLGTNIESEDSKSKLTIISAELEELKLKAGQMKQKTIELEKHKNSLELKSLISRKNILTTEIEELKRELESMREQKIESQNSLVEIRANYDNFYDSYNEEIARLLFEEKKAYSGATSRPTEDVTLERFKVDERLTTVCDEKLRLEEEINRIKDKCDAVDSEIIEIQDKISDITIPEEKKELIVQAKDLESEIIIYDAMLVRVGALLDDNKQELKNVKEKYSTELQAERKIEEDLKKIEESTAKVFENSEISNFQKLRSCDKTLSDIAKVETELLNIDTQCLKIRNRIISRKQKIENVKAAIIKQQEAYEQKLQYAKSIKQNLEKFQETREELLGSNCLGLIIKYTNIGDSCPICKSRVTEKNYKEVMDLTGIEREIEMTKSKLGIAEKDANSTQCNIFALKAIEDYEQAQIELDEKEIQSLQSSKTKIYQRVVDINDKTEENFINLKNALMKTSNALENVLTIQQKLESTIKENVSNKVEYGTRISMLSELDENLIDLYYVLQKERAEREILMLEAKANVSENDFDEKRSELGTSEAESQALVSELVALCLQSSELKAKMFAAKEKLEKVEYERGVLETQKTTLGVVCDEPYGEQEDLYDSQSVKDKIEELKQTHKHLLSLKTDAENSLNNLLKEYEVKTKLLAYKIDEQQDVSALVSSLIYRYNFTSEDEVKEYIVTDNMLKLKESEIKNYNSALQKLELQKDFLTQGNVDVDYAELHAKLVLRKQELIKRLGELSVLIESTENSLNEYKQIELLIKKYN